MTRRVLLKLSGEALMGAGQFGIDPEALSAYATQIAQAQSQGVEVGVVVGGGNIFRGVQGSTTGMDRATADTMGMMATVMNALALTDALKASGARVSSFCSLEMPRVMQLFTHRDARAALERGEVCVFAGGTGSPFFTTDTGAALKAAELDADEVLKATQVDGVYDADPRVNSSARRYAQLSHADCLSQGLQVMDSAAFSLCQASSLSIRIFNLHQEGALIAALLGEPLGTVVGPQLEARFA